MNRIAEMLSCVHGGAQKIESAIQLLEAVGYSLISINAKNLMDYRKRIDSLEISQFHTVYRSFGVYFIEFPRKIYVGSTGGGAMYFGRRWKSHVNRPDAQSCLVPLMESTPMDRIIFHAIACTSTDSEARFIEYGVLAFMEKACPWMIANPIHVEMKKQRNRNLINEKNRRHAIFHTASATKSSFGQKLLFGPHPDKTSCS